ncbi:MAG: hypothetical protein R3C40_10770 [Parvularculaceae bacterium]
MVNFPGVRKISCAFALVMSVGCASYVRQDAQIALAHNSPPAVADISRVPSKIVLAEALTFARANDDPLPDDAARKAAKHGWARLHEGKAAELWAGRRFYARGKIIDNRTEDKPPIALASANTNGWRVLNQGGDDERLVHQESGLECLRNRPDTR